MKKKTEGHSILKKGRGQGKAKGELRRGIKVKDMHQVTWEREVSSTEKKNAGKRPSWNDLWLWENKTQKKSIPATQKIRNAALTRGWEPP